MTTARTIDSFLRFMGLTSQTNQKGNNGQGAARRRFKFLGVILMALVCLLGVVHLCLPASTSRIESSVMRHAKGLRLDSRRATTTTTKSGHYSHHEMIEFILTGKLNLVEIRTNNKELAAAPKDSYDGVYGVFCRLNFDVHKSDPSAVPMFRDLVAKSPMCDEEYNEDKAPNDDEEGIPRGRVHMNLKELAETAREADRKNMYPGAKNLELTGVVFHESRCGSTLVANSLIAMNPAEHRVYSESAPPLAALSLCTHDGDSGGACSTQQGAQILRDVIYFMGRTDNLREERYFFKIQSAGTKALPIFRQAFPKTPWIFVYRDPVQVMMSHFAHGTKSANCLRGMQHPNRMLQKLARRRGYMAGGGGGHRRRDDDENTSEEKTLKELSPPEFCAAHLATLTETAASHIKDSNGLGKAVNYVSLPNILYEEILPSWGVDVSEQEILNIQRISGKYSKGRGNQKKEWRDDSEKKEEAASPEIIGASKIFLQESFDQLEELAKLTKAS